MKKLLTGVFGLGIAFLLAGCCLDSPAYKSNLPDQPREYFELQAYKYKADQVKVVYYYHPVKDNYQAKIYGQAGFEILEKYLYPTKMPDHETGMVYTLKKLPGEDSTFILKVKKADSSKEKTIRVYWRKNAEFPQVQVTGLHNKSVRIIEQK